MNPILRRLFKILDERRIRYCVLRNYDEIELNSLVSGDIDLLLDRSQLQVFIELLDSNFDVMRSKSPGEHQHYKIRDHANKYLIILDVHTELYFSASGSLYRIPVEKKVLNNRRRRLLFFVPSEADEFVTLSLHTLLDKPFVFNKHLEKLRSLCLEFGDQSKGSPLITWIGRRNDHLYCKSLLMGDYEELVQVRWQIQKTLFWRDPFRTAGRAILRWIRTKQNFFNLFRWRQPFTVALVGGDGAGKTTLAKHLAQWFGGRYVYMGSKDSLLPSSRLIERFSKSRCTKGAGMPELKMSKNVNVGHIGQNTTRRDFFKIYLTRPLMKINLILELFARYYHAIILSSSKQLIIFDRYVYDHILYLSVSESRQRGVVTNFMAFCFKTFFPKPDLLILLTCDPETLYARKKEGNIAGLQNYQNTYRKLVFDELSGIQLFEVETDRVFSETINRLENLIVKNLI